MKKTVFLFLGLLMLQASEAIAQVKFGIKAGVNINNVSMSDGLGYSVSKRRESAACDIANRPGKPVQRLSPPKWYGLQS